MAQREFATLRIGSYIPGANLLLRFVSYCSGTCIHKIRLAANQDPTRRHQTSTLARLRRSRIVTVLIRPQGSGDGQVLKFPALH